MDASVRQHSRLRRDFDARRVNAIANDPEVQPYEGPLDLTPLILDTRNVCLMTDHGGLVFLFAQPMIYEAHVYFLPVARGEEALAATREAQRWMFARSDAIELQMKFHQDRRPVLGLVRAMRARLEFESKGWKHFTIRYPDWAQNDPTNKHLGVWFRELLEAKLLTRGRSEPQWTDEDMAQDSALGATITTIRAGQLDKALLFYDRWARFANAPSIGLVARWPVTLDLGFGLITIFDESLGSFDVEIV